MAWRDLRGDGRVVAGAHHVGEREKRGQQGVVLADVERVERAVGERSAASGSRSGEVDGYVPDADAWSESLTAAERADRRELQLEVRFAAT